MKADERFNNYDLDGDFISYLKVSSNSRLEVYAENGTHILSGAFVDDTRFNLYDLGGRFHSYGRVVDASHYNLFDEEGDQLGYGKKQ